MATKRSRKSSSTDLAQAARWVFLAGLAISIVAGLVFSFPMGGDTAWQEWVVYVVIALGLVGGYLHIAKGSEHEFILIALGVAVFSDRLGYIPALGNYLGSIFGMVGLFLAMAVMAIVVRNIVDWFRS